MDNMSFVFLEIGEVLDSINVLFWVFFVSMFLIGIIIGAIKSSKNRASSSQYRNAERNLMNYLIKRIEDSGIRNNMMRNDSLLAGAGFIGAINDEKNLLISQSSGIAKQYNVSEFVVKDSIEKAFNFVYNKYIE